MMNELSESKLLTKIQSDLISAMKSRNSARVNALRLIKAALSDKEKEYRKTLSSEQENQILQRMVKQRNESIVIFEKAGRTDLSTKEQFERSIISDYLPEPVAEYQIEKTVGEVIEDLGARSTSDMGNVMKATMLRLQVFTGVVDGKVVSSIVRRKLS